MKKIIAALFISLTPLMAMESKAPEVEMYPDERPKSKCLFVGDIPRFFKETEPESILSKYKIDKVNDFLLSSLKKTFKELNFYYLSHEDSVFISNNLKNNKTIVLFTKNREVKSVKDGIIFQKKSIKSHYNFSEEKKWDYEESIQKDYVMMKFGTLNLHEVYEFSWKYIDMTLHRFPLGSNTEYNKKYVGDLYNHIDKKGLVNSMARIVFLYSQDEEKYSINIAFDKEEESEIVEEIKQLLFEFRN